jgi:DNA-binding NarL/FixJ family response regulator
MMINIAIADDHPMIINGIKDILSDCKHIVFTGTYTNGSELMEGLKEGLPDILLLDIQLPDKTGDKLLLEILKKYPDFKVIALTNFDSTLYVSNMIHNGAKGYLLKTVDKNTLITALEAVYRGELYIEPSMKEKVDLIETGVNRTLANKFMLKPREKQVLQLIVNGMTNAEIALSLSIHTVHNYRDNILLKMEVKNTAALVKKALTLGWAE